MTATVSDCNQKYWWYMQCTKWCIYETIVIFLYMNTDTYLQCRKMNSKGKIQKCNLSIAEYIAVFVHKHTQKTFLSHVSWLSLKIGLAVVWWGVIELILSKQRFSQLETNSWLRLLCCFLLASDICWKPGCRFRYLPCRQPLNLKFNPF